MTGDDELGELSKGEEWTPVEPSGELITCNIGDMLMRWSDDQLASNFHRVKGPAGAVGDRYSIAFFAQASRGAVIDSPTGKYSRVTAGEYLQQRISANFATG